MHYLTEMKMHWRALLAASLGLAAGNISNYINNLFSPSLIAEFGWAKSQFALIGLTVVISAICLPIAGRVADRVGTKRIATIGVISLPLVFVGLSLMNGSFLLFFILSLAQMLTVSCLAGVIIYSRLVAKKFDKARGIALGLAACAPALATAFFSPVLSHFITDYGWRAGYLVMAVYAAVAGGAALLLIPSDYDDRVVAVPGAPRPQHYGAILRSRAFQLIFVATLLCNVHFTIQTSQIKVILTTQGLGSETASVMVSILAIGVVFGRIICGLALDRFPAYIVAAVSFAIPSAGLAILAGNIPDTMFVGFAILSLGLSMGAEGDLVVYLAARYFRTEMFSSVAGLFTGAMAIAASLGALLLNLTLKQTDSYTLFLSITAVSMLMGSLSFLLLPWAIRRDEAAAIAKGDLPVVGTDAL